MKVEMTGKLLRETLDFGLSTSGKGSYLQWYNIERSPKGEWIVKGQLLDDNKNYNIVLNDFLMLGLDIPFLKDDNPGVLNIYTPESDEVAADLRKAIIHYFKTSK